MEPSHLRHAQSVVSSCREMDIYFSATILYIVQ